MAWSQISGSSGAWEYAFTNLTAEDSSEAAAQMKAANIPFKLDAGGAALSVPASKVYDARLMLAAQGLPRGGGVGFEIFDRGDLGVSEFTQRINLRRAIEGELSRTIGHFAAVRSARVHVTMPEKGLYRDEDRKAAAGVALTLQPGRTLNDRRDRRHSPPGVVGRRGTVARGGDGRRRERHGAGGRRLGGGQGRGRPARDGASVRAAHHRSVGAGGGRGRGRGQGQRRVRQLGGRDDQRRVRPRDERGAQ